MGSSCPVKKHSLVRPAERHTESEGLCTRHTRSPRSTRARVFYAEGANRAELLARAAKRKSLTRAPVPHINPAFRDLGQAPSVAKAS